MSDMLNCLAWKTLQSRRTIARLSLLYKLRNNLACLDILLLHAHLGMILSYPLLSVIFISFPSFKNFTEMEQTAKISSIGKIA